MSVLSVIRAVDIAGRDSPQRPSLLFVEPGGTRQFSAGDVSAAMSAWAYRLLPMRPVGSASGAAIAVIVAPRGFDAYGTLLGAMRAGLAGCILPGPTAKQEGAAYWESHRIVLRRIAPVVVIAPLSLHPLLADVLPAGTPLVDPSSAAPEAEGQLPPMDDVDGDSVPNILQHSSGTTGLKKGVVLTHGQVRQQVEAYARALSMTSADTVASWLPLYHDMGLVTSVLLPLSLGSMVVSMDPFDWLVRPASILEVVSRYRAALCWLPNFAFAHLVNTAAEAGVFDLSSVRSFIDCSEPCRAATLEAFTLAFAAHGLAPGAVSTCYAMAETVFAVTQSPLGRVPKVVAIDRDAMSMHSVAVCVKPRSATAVRIVSCGPPIENAALRITAVQPKTRAPLSMLASLLASPSAPPPAGSPIGEVMVSSSSAFSGYHRDPEASAASFDGLWYRTGDLGFMHAGELYITGRIKDLIIVNGRNVYAHDIEEAANRVEGVKPGRAAAFGIDRASTGSQAVIVVVESVAEAGLLVETITRGIRDAVSQALGLVLHEVLVRPPGVLVKTTSGKVSREANRRRYLDGAMP